MVRSCARSGSRLGLLRLPQDIDVSAKPEVLFDRGTAPGFAGRAGSGQSDMYKRGIYVQERNREGHVKILPVRDTMNPAYLFTKAVNGSVKEYVLKVRGGVTSGTPDNHKHLFDDPTTIYGWTSKIEETLDDGIGTRSRDEPPHPPEVAQNSDLCTVIYDKLDHKV